MTAGSRILLACATRRGLRCLERISELAPDAELVVASFKETAWEPPFLDSIEEAARIRGASFRQLRRLEEHAELLDPVPDLLLMVNWRYLVPAAVYGRARLGSFTLHDSLLPTYRGFSPTCWSIINGKESTGVTLFETGAELDAGPIVGQVSVPIGSTETIATVTERVTEAYLSLLDEWLAPLLAGNAPRRIQDESAATYTKQRRPEDDGIDWTQPAKRVFDLVRGRTRPYTGAFTTLNGERLRVWSADPPDGKPVSEEAISAGPGRVLEIVPGEGVRVLAGDGALLLREVQFGDAEPANAADVIGGSPVTLG